MCRTSSGRLLMIRSTFIKRKYAVAVVRSDNDEIDGHFIHQSPLITNDGGHGMIFKAWEQLMLTYHTPHKTDFEHPTF